MAISKKRKYPMIIPPYFDRIYLRIIEIYNFIEFPRF